MKMREFNENQVWRQILSSKLDFHSILTGLKSKMKAKGLELAKNSKRLLLSAEEKKIWGGHAPLRPAPLSRGSKNESQIITIRRKLGFLPSILPIHWTSWETAYLKSHLSLLSFFTAY